MYQLFKIRCLCLCFSGNHIHHSFLMRDTQSHLYKIDLCLMCWANSIIQFYLSQKLLNHDKFQSIPLPWSFLFWNSQSVVAEWLEHASQSVIWNVLSWSGGHEFDSYHVELGVHSTSVLSCIGPKVVFMQDKWLCTGTQGFNLPHLSIYCWQLASLEKTDGPVIRLYNAQKAVNLKVFCWFVLCNLIHSMHWINGTSAKNERNIWIQAHRHTLT